MVALILYLFDHLTRWIDEILAGSLASMLLQKIDKVDGKVDGSTLVVGNPRLQRALVRRGVGAVVEDGGQGSPHAAVIIDCRRQKKRAALAERVTRWGQKSRADGRVLVISRGRARALCSATLCAGLVEICEDRRGCTVICSARRAPWAA